MISTCPLLFFLSTCHAYFSKDGGGSNPQSNLLQYFQGVNFASWLGRDTRHSLNLMFCQQNHKPSPSLRLQTRQKGTAEDIYKQDLHSMDTAQVGPLMPIYTEPSDPFRASPTSRNNNLRVHPAILGFEGRDRSEVSPSRPVPVSQEDAVTRSFSLLESSRPILLLLLHYHLRAPHLCIFP